jgi:hypothetical protein
MWLRLASILAFLATFATRLTAQPTFSPEVKLPEPRPATAGGLTATLVSMDGAALVVRADDGTLVPFRLDNESTVPAGLVPGTRVTVRYEPLEAGYRVDSVGIPRIPSDPDATTEPPPEATPAPAPPEAPATPSPEPAESSLEPPVPRAERVADTLRTPARRARAEVREVRVAASTAPPAVDLADVPPQAGITEPTPASEAAADDVLALMAIAGFLIVSGGLGVVAFRRS